MVSVEEWRPLEPAHVEKARLARRSGRYARYQQVVRLREQGMKTPEIARQLRMGERTVREWLKQGTFPEAKKRRVAGKAPLMPLHALCFHALKRGKEKAWRCGEQSRNKATRDQSEPSIGTWRHSNKPRGRNDAAPEALSESLAKRIASEADAFLRCLVCRWLRKMARFCLEKFCVRAISLLCSFSWLQWLLASKRVKNLFVRKAK